MIKIVKAESDHLLELKSLGVGGLDIINEENAGNISSLDNSFALVNAYGQTLGLVGVTETEIKTWEAWAIFSPYAGNYMLGITRAVKGYLKGFPSGRIEGTVAVEFYKGHRWLELLGFYLVAPCLVRYRGSQDYALYYYDKEDI